MLIGGSGRGIVLEFFGAAARSNFGGKDCVAHRPLGAARVEEMVAETKSVSRHKAVFAAQMRKLLGRLHFE